jgi:hypothetical protein
MPTSTELTTLVLDRLQAFDPSIDISEGAPARVHIVDPLITALGTDPFETDIREFLIARLQEAHPTLDVRGDSDVLLDTLVDPLTTFLEPFKREINTIKLAQSLSSPESLSEADVDAHMANLFFSRITGQKASGRVRMFFNAPTSLSVTSLTKYTTSAGLAFFPTATQSVTSDSMLLNQEGSLFYFDVTVEAEQEGIEYNVEADAIVKVEGLPSVTQVTNPTAMTTLGSRRETNREFVDRGEVALSERSLNTERGLSARLMELYPGIRAIQAIGYRDVEMDRDIITGTVSLVTGDLGLGAIIQMGSNGVVAAVLTITVGGVVLGDASNLAVSLLTRNGGGAFTSQMVVGNRVTLFHAGLNGGAPTEFTVGGLTGQPDPTATATYFNSYRWVANTGSDGATTLFDVSANSPALGTEGADLPFTNIFTTTGGNFYDPTDPVNVGDFLFVQDVGPPAILETGTSTVASILSPTSLQTSSVITVLQVGDLATAREGTVTAGNNGFFDIRSAVTQAGPPSMAGATLVLATDAGVPILGVGGEEWFTVNLIDQVGPAGFTRLTVTPNIAGGAGAANVRWSAVTAALTSAPGILNAPLLPALATTVTWAFRRTAAGHTLYAPVTAAVDVVYSERAPLAVATVNASSVLSLSDIPGGILFPETAQGTLEVPNNQIHIGGMTDAYLLPSDITERTATVTLEDDSPLVQNTDGVIDFVVDPNRFNSALGNFITAGVVVGDTLVIKDVQPGNYRIINVLSGTELEVVDHASPDVDPFTASGTLIRYEVVREITIDLVTPKDIKIPNSVLGPAPINPITLVTNLGSDTVTTNPTVNFVDEGVEIGDTLEILSGLEQGTYTINAFAGATNQSLVLATVLNGGETGLEYQVYTLAATGGLTRPLLRIKKIELLGANGEPSGTIVPYALPVDIRSSDFGNRGDGIKIPNATMTGNDLVTNLAAQTTLTRAANSVTNFLTAGVVPGDVIAWTSGPNTGLRRVIDVVTGAGAATLVADATQIIQDDAAGAIPDNQPNMGDYTIGAVSIGSARLYFLDPTSVSVDNGTIFTTESGLAYTPDPSNHAVIYDPDLPGVGDFVVAPSDDELLWTTANQTAFQMGLVAGAATVGDYVDVGYYRVEGAAPADLSVAGNRHVSGQTLIIEEHGVATHTVSYQGANPVPLTSTAGFGGILEQTRAQLPTTFNLEVVTNFLSFSNKNRFTITGGTARAGMLNLATGTTNWHADVGTYVVAAIVSDRRIRVTDLAGAAPTFAGTLATYQLSFRRPRTQRISSTTMATQTENGLYYFDVQMVSAAAGNLYNLADDTRMTVTGLAETEGYRITTDNTSTTYSTGEESDLQVRPRLLRVGEDDEILARTLLPSSDVRVTYETSPTVSDVQGTLLLDTERVINNNPLAKHYFPAYTRLVFNYSGGSLAAVVKQDLVDHINNLGADTTLDASDLQGLAKDRGATYIQEPSVLIAISHQDDRTIRGYRSEDRLQIARDEHFLADVDHITVTRI